MSKNDNPKLIFKPKLNTDTIQNKWNKAIEKGLKSVANRVIAATLPYSIQEARTKSPSRVLTKKPLNALKKRIQGDISGKIQSAFVGKDGESMIDIKGDSYMPFIVPRGKQKPTFLVTNTNLLLNHLKNNTKVTNSKKVMTRYMKKGASIIWTTKETINDLVKRLQARVGNFISGWDKLAQKIGNKTLQKLLSGQDVDKDGEASLSVSNKGVRLEAANYNVPKNKQSYGDLVEDNIERWTTYAIKNELKYINRNKR